VVALYAGECGAGGHHVDIRRTTGLRQRTDGSASLGEEIGKPPPAVGMTQPGARVCLRVHVNDKDALPLFGERGGEVDRSRRLAGAAFLIGHC